MTTTDPAASNGDVLGGISCTGPDFCVAVGASGTGTQVPLGGGFSRPGTNTLAELWNGSTWLTMTTTADPGGTNPGDSFNSVSCTIPSFCMAVGGYGLGSSFNPSQAAGALAEEWDGSTWTTLPTPNPTGSGVLLGGVSCTSPSFCMAIGDIFTDSRGTSATFAEVWDGSTWSLTNQTLNPGTGTWLAGVSCTPTPAISCMAVGGYGSGGPDVDGQPYSTLAELWNGSTWSTTTTTNPVPSASRPGNWLAGVSCTSPSFCMAVGGHAGGGVPGNTLAEVWNGTTWSTSPTTNPPGFGIPAPPDGLESVTCTNPSFCAAVGPNAPKGPQPGLTLAELWNGSTWSTSSTTDPAPTPSGQTSGDNRLTGVSCTPSNFCISVGDYPTVSAWPCCDSFFPENWVTLAEALGLATTSPQAIDGNLKVAQGSTLSAGFDFTMPGTHPSATVGFTGTQVNFQATCSSGTAGTETISVNIPDETYNGPANNSTWYPSGNQNSASTYQGATKVPSFCDPGALVSLQQGGQFSTLVGSTDTTDTVNVRWHYADGTGGGWSGTL